MRLRTKLGIFHLNIYCSIWSYSGTEVKVPMLKLVNMLTNTTQGQVYVLSRTLCADQGRYELLQPPSKGVSALCSKL